MEPVRVVEDRHDDGAEKISAGQPDPVADALAEQMEKMASADGSSDPFTLMAGGHGQPPESSVSSAGAAVDAIPRSAAPAAQAESPATTETEIIEDSDADALAREGQWC